VRTRADAEAVLEFQKLMHFLVGIACRQVPM